MVSAMLPAEGSVKDIMYIYPTPGFPQLANGCCEALYNLLGSRSLRSLAAGPIRGRTTVTTDVVTLSLLFHSPLSPCESG